MILHKANILANTQVESQLWQQIVICNCLRYMITTQSRKDKLMNLLLD